MNLDDRVDALLASPAGCAFVLLVDESDRALEDVLSPPNVFFYSCAALAEVEVWKPNHLATVNHVLQRARTRRDLAIRILDHPLAQWWFEPLDRAHQMRVGPHGDRCWDDVETPTQPPNNSERYAQRPMAWRVTSTLRRDASSAQMCMQMGVGDWWYKAPYRREEITIGEAARVF